MPRIIDTVSLILPSCTECGSPHLRTTRSEDNGDDTRTRWTVCRTCGHHFRVIVKRKPFFGRPAGEVCEDSDYEHRRAS
jgi:DNA-directed RNA polymerase subunit RPC12/RpoP